MDSPTATQAAGSPRSCDSRMREAAAVIETDWPELEISKKRPESESRLHPPGALGTSVVVVVVAGAGGR